MIIAHRADGLFFRIERSETKWVASPDDATVFASIAALAQCVVSGRLSRLGFSEFRVKP